MDTLKNLFLVLGLFAICHNGIGQIIHVPADQPTIQDGINVAMFHGDTVIVADGNYEENIDFLGRPIVVASNFILDGDTNHIHNTIIDGDQNGSTVSFTHGEDSIALLCGFTITGGSGTEIGPPTNWSQPFGGGIFLENSSPRLSNLIISENEAESAAGAGICCKDGSHPRIENVIIKDNFGDGPAMTNDGAGGICLFSSSPTMVNVQIFNNEGLLAGGIFCNDDSNPTLINVIIADNIALPSVNNDETAEFIAWNDSHPVLINTIIWSYSYTSIVVRESSSITVRYSSVLGGETGIVCYPSGNMYWLEGNMDKDPEFVDAGNNDYRLLQESPCIDAGTPDTLGLSVPAYDFAGNVRIWDGNQDGDTIIDIGAYEYGAPLWVSIHEDHINHNNFDMGLNLYPNPASDILNISTQWDQKLIKLCIYSATGVIVMEESSVHGTVNISHLQAGLYLVDLMVEDKNVRKKLLIQR